MSSTTQDSTHIDARDGAGSRQLPARTAPGRRRRRALAPWAGLALAAALLAGCGSTPTEDPAEDPEVTATVEDPATEADPGEEETTDEDAEVTDPSDRSEETTGLADAPTTGENLFEGTWGFGHDTKVLSAEELADLLEEQAESRGPEEMSLDVECADGVDSGAGDETAECIAYADEGVQHPWSLTVGPADSGLEIEVANVG